MSDKQSSKSATSRSRSPSPAKKRTKSSGKRSRTYSDSKSRSRSRSYKRRSRSDSHDRKYSRSRSNSYKRRSRSRSYDKRRSSKYGSGRDRYDDRRSGDYGYSRDRSRSRSPMSHRRRHLGDRENPTTSRCLGVFGLSLYTQERDLRDVFGRFGPIDDLQIVYDHQTGKSRGFGFIYYKNVEDAVEAKESAPGTEIDGRSIRVDYSITKRAHTPTPGVYLGRPYETSGYSRGATRRSRSPYKPKGRRSRSYSHDRSYSPRRY